MIYYFLEYLKILYPISSIKLFQYISVRSVLGFVFSLCISLIYGKKIIKLIKKKQLNEEIRNLGLIGQKEKEGTPTMGGLIIILSTLISTFLFSKLNNIYVIILIISVIWMGSIGFLDDYIKIFKKKKEGLKAHLKILFQIIFGIFIGSIMYFNKNITIKEKIKTSQKIESIHGIKIDYFFSIEQHNTKTTMPFFRNNEFDYAWILQSINKNLGKYVWIIFIPIIILIIISVSNGANLTDGIDGLTAGTSLVIIITLILFSWLSGNMIFSSYFNIMYIPNVGEIVVFSSIFIGSLIGFLWYNIYPAQIFMGDTGSMTIGGVISVLAIATRKELILLILCGIFLIESLSVILQVIYFKYTKWIYGTGKRIFLMAPLHHHFQMKKYHENKITNRFIIIQILLAFIVIISLKIR